MLIFFFPYSCQWTGDKSEIIIRLEVVIKKDEKYSLKKLIKKRSNSKKKREIVRLENEVITFEIIFGLIPWTIMCEGF